VDYDALFTIEPFALDFDEKTRLFNEWIPSLCAHHQYLCPEYRLLCEILGPSPSLPVRLFKEFDLRSIEGTEVVKTMTSSGTSGQQVSKIYLDRETSARQTKALSKIVSSFTGKERLSMLVIDSSEVIKNRQMFSARGAGILGFSMLGRNITYALDEEMKPNLDVVMAFCEQNKHKKVLAFGFTSIVWQQFCQELLKQGIQLDLDGYLIHGGGWKKLEDQKVDNGTFKAVVKQTCGITQVFNYYGMVEQTGSICMECKAGNLHTSIFSDIEIVDPFTLKTNNSRRGLIKTISLLPTSYPGHILLTEDEGEVLGIDDCTCGRLGKYFKVYGRMKDAEIRGCSDTYGQ